MAFPKTALDFDVWLALGADLTADPGTWVWTTNITAYVLKEGDGGGITIHRGRPDESTQAPPQTCGMTLNNAAGRFCPLNPLSPYYGSLSRATPIRVRVNNGGGYVVRFVGFVEEWPPRFSPGLRFAWTPIEASGLLRRMGLAGASATRSALTRALSIQSTSPGLSVDPIAYWPMEDGRDAPFFASATPFTPPIGFVDWAPASDSALAGSSALPVGGPNGQLFGQVPWVFFSAQAVRWLMRLPASPSTTTGLMAWNAPESDITTWVLYLVPGTPDKLQLVGRNAAGTDLVADAGVNCVVGSTELSSSGLQLYFVVNAIQNGGNVDWDYTVHSAAGSVTRSGTVVGATQFSSRIASVYFSAYPGLVAGGYTVGHITVAGDTTYGIGSFGTTGFGTETTAARWARLTAERFFDSSTGASTTRMGPQQAAGLLDMLRDVETAEVGVLFEGADGALVLQTRDDRYNSPVKLALDFALTHIAEPFEPTADDQRTRNDVQVSIVDGSKGRFVDQASIAALGGAVYEESVNANLDAVEDPQSHAGWRVGLGTVQDLRYPAVTILLHANPSLINAWLLCDIGSRVTIRNPPAGLPPDLVDLLIEGYTEVLDAFEWTVTLNTSPAQPWQVLVLDDASAHLDMAGDTSGQALVAAISSTATTFQVENASEFEDVELTTAAGDVPFDIVVDGEQMTVTNVAAAPITFVAAGTAASAVNAGVTPGMPPGAAVGDELLVWAAIRNTSASANTPTGWETGGGGNASLFTRRMQAGDTAPTMTFTGGGAGDDVIAQMCAFRNTDEFPSRASVQSNGAAAQDIGFAAGGISVLRPNQVIVIAGWKQDDWTSVATVAGFTEIGEPDSTAGNDAGIVWDYQIQTTAVNVPDSVFTVTGGAAAVSASTVTIFPNSRRTLTVTRSVNGVVKAHSAGAVVRLYRPRVIAL